MYGTLSLFLGTDMRNVHIAIFIKFGTFGVPFVLRNGIKVSFLLGVEIPLIQFSIFRKVCEHVSCNIESTIIVKSSWQLGVSPFLWIHRVLNNIAWFLRIPFPFWKCVWNNVIKIMNNVRLDFCSLGLEVLGTILSVLDRDIKIFSTMIMVRFLTLIVFLSMLDLSSCTRWSSR